MVFLATVHLESIENGRKNNSTNTEAKLVVVMDTPAPTGTVHCIKIGYIFYSTTYFTYQFKKSKSINNFLKAFQSKVIFQELLSELTLNESKKDVFYSTTYFIYRLKMSKSINKLFKSHSIKNYSLNV